MEFQYGLKLINEEVYFFVSNIEDIVEVTKEVMSSKFVLIDCKCINTDKIVYVGKASKGSLSARYDKEYLTLIKE